MERKRAVRISKFLSLVLRHNPASAGVVLDREGWAEVDALVSGAARHGVRFNRAELEDVVTSNDKQRFTFSEDGCRIRARQGHSLPVDLGLLPVHPPATLFHGTVERFMAAIMEVGLERQSRQYVHLSADIPTAERVGGRRGTPVILRVAAGEMAAAGHQFFLSENGVWLTRSVPAQFIDRVDT